MGELTLLRRLSDNLVPAPETEKIDPEQVDGRFGVGCFLTAFFGSICAETDRELQG